MRKYYKLSRRTKWHISSDGNKTLCGWSVEFPYQITTQGGMRKGLFCQKCVDAQAKADKLVADMEGVK